MAFGSLLQMAPSNANSNTSSALSALQTSSATLPWSNKRIAGASPFPNRGFSATVVNSKDIFIIGGTSPGKLDATLNEPVCQVSVLGTSGLSSYTHPLSTTGNSPSARSEHAAALVGKKIYVFGGQGPHVAYDDGFYVFNTETKAWSRPRLQGEAPLLRRGHSAVTVGSRIYIFGGISEEGTYLSEMIILDTTTMNCYLHVFPANDPRFPLARAHHAAVVHGDNMIIYGGDSGYECLDDIWLLDTTSSPTDIPKWTCMKPSNPIPNGRYQHAAVPIGDCLYVFGGNDCRGRPLRDTLVYDFTTNMWSHASPMPYTRSGHVLCVTKDKVYLLGGHDTESKDHDFNHVGVLDLHRIKRVSLPVISPLSPPPSPGPKLFRKSSSLSTASRQGGDEASTPKEESKSFKADLDRLQKERASALKELDRLRSNLNASEKQKSTAENQAKKELDSLRDQLNQREQTVKQLEKQVKDLKSQQDSDAQSKLHAEVTLLKNQLSKMSLKALEMERNANEANTRLKEITTDLNAERKKTSSLELLSRQQEDTVSHQQRLYEGAAQENDKLRLELSKIKTLMANMDNDLQAKQKRQSKDSEFMTKSLEELTLERNGLRSALDQLKQETERKKRENASAVFELEKKCEKLEHDKKQVESERDRIRNDLTSKQSVVSESLGKMDADFALAKQECQQLKTDLANKLSEMEEARRNASVELKSCQQRLAASEQDRSRLSSELQESKDKSEQMLQDFTVVRHALEEARAHHRVDDFKATEADWHQRVEEQNHRIQELESMLTQLRSELEVSHEREYQAQDKVFALTTALNKITLNVNSSTPVSPQSSDCGSTLHTPTSASPTAFDTQSPPVTSNVPVPPPPPMPSCGSVPVAPAAPPPPKLLTSASMPPVRSNLLAEIQAGAKLKSTPISPVESSGNGSAPAKVPSDPMSQMLAEMARKKLRQHSMPASRSNAQPSMDPELAKKLNGRHC